MLPTPERTSPPPWWLSTGIAPGASKIISEALPELDTSKIPSLPGTGIPKASPPDSPGLLSTKNRRALVQALYLSSNYLGSYLTVPVYPSGSQKKTFEHPGAHCRRPMRTMDPFSAIGLAGNIIAFIDFGFKTISAAREIYKAPSGATAEDVHLGMLTSTGMALALDLKYRKPLSEMTSGELRLQELADECCRVSDGLLLLLGNLKAAKPHSKRESLRAILRRIWKKSEEEVLRKRLDGCKQQLLLQLSQNSWHVFTYLPT